MTGTGRPPPFVYRPMGGRHGEARFERLFAAHYAAIAAYARRRLPAEDAADVVAETFLVAWRRLGEVPDGDAARLWLFGVARRQLANQRRGALRRSRLRERLAAELDGLGSAPPVERDPALHAALARLPERDRELLLLVAWDGLTPRELAVVLGCSANAASIRLHRARRNLRAALDRYDERIDPVRTRARTEGQWG